MKKVFVGPVKSGKTLEVCNNIIHHLESQSISKVLVCCENKFASYQMKQYILKKSPILSRKIQYFIYYDLLKKILRISDFEQCTLKYLLSLFSTGKFDDNMRSFLSAYDLVAFDQTEKLIDCLLNVLSTLPIQKNLLLSFDVPTTDSVAFAETLVTALPDFEIKRFSNHNLDQRLINEEWTNDFKDSWFLFMQLIKRKVPDTSIQLGWSPVVVLNTNNEKYLKAALSSIHRLSARSGMRNVWDFKKDLIFPREIYDLYIVSKYQASGLTTGFAMNVNFDQFLASKDKNLDTIEEKALTILVTDENAYNIFGKNPRQYQFYVNGEPASVIDSSFAGSSSEWWVEMRLIYSAIRLHPTKIIVEIRN